MEYEKRLCRKILCANCGKMGHEFKYCNDPPTSFGVINIKILNDTNESLIICDKFSTKQNVFYHIRSKNITISSVISQIILNYMKITMIVIYWTMKLSHMKWMSRSKNYTITEIKFCS